MKSKKILSGLLSAAMVCSSLANVAFAADGAVVGVNAETSSVYVDFEGVDDLTAAEDLSAIKLLTADGSQVEATVNAMDSDTAVIKPAAELTKDVLYKVSVDSAIGLASDYEKTFAVTNIFTDDFESYAEGADIWKQKTFTNTRKAMSVNDNNKMVLYAPGFVSPTDANAADWSDYTLKMKHGFAYTCGSLEGSDHVTDYSLYFLATDHSNGYRIRFANHFEAYLEKVTDGTSKQLAEVGLYDLLGQNIDKNDDGTNTAAETTTMFDFKLTVSNGMAYFYIDDKLALQGRIDVENPKGTFAFSTNGGASSLAIIDDVELSKMVEPKNVNVTDYSVDSKKVTVEFDDELGAISDFSFITLTADGTEVDCNYTVSGNEISVVPQSGINSDAIYELSVNSGYINSLSNIEAGFNKMFGLKTLFADDFEGNATADGSTTAAGWAGGANNRQAVTINNDKMFWVYNAYNLLSPTTVTGASEWADYTIEMERGFSNGFGSESTNQSGLYASMIYFCSTDQNNGYRIRFDANNASLQKVTGGTATTIGSPVTFSESPLKASLNVAATADSSNSPQMYDFKVAVKGTTVRFYIDDNLILEETIDAGAKGKFGLVTSSIAYNFVDDVVITNVVEYEPETVAVNSYNVRDNEIVLKFDKSIAKLDENGQDLIVVEDGDSEIECTYEVNGDEIIVKPVSGAFTVGKAYDVSVMPGNLNPIQSVTTPFLKRFNVKTLFADDFESYESGTQIWSQKSFTVARNALAVNGDNKMVLCHPGLVTPVDENSAAWSDYTLKMSHGFSKSCSSITSNTLDYIYNYSLHFLSDDNGNGYQLFFESNGNKVSLQQITGRVVSGGSVNEGTATTIGNSETLTSSSLGEQLVNADTPENAKMYDFKLTVSGGNVYFYINDKLILEETLPEDGPTSGTFGFRDVTTYWSVIDDVTLTSIEYLNPTVEFGKLTVYGSDGTEINTPVGQTAVSGNVVVKNFTDSAQPLKVIVAAYGADNEMLGAQIIPNVSSIDAHANKPYNFSLSGIDGVKTVKVYAWDDFTNLSPYSARLCLPE